MVKSQLFWVLLASLVFRLFLGLTLDFGVDESYILAQAINFQWSYVDHPPLHIWLGGLMLKVFGVSPLVRLPFILSFTLTSYVLYLITRHLYDEKSGLWAVISLQLSLFFMASAGLMVVPDGLLILFCALSLLFYLRGQFIYMGIALGLAGLSKYHAALFALSLGVYILIYQRDLLKNQRLWLGALIALLLQTPVILWNYNHEWVSFAFQASRGGYKGLNLNQFLQMVIGQFLFLSPWVFIPLIMAVWKNKIPQILAIIAIPIILLFTFTPLWGSRGLPHWTMLGWFFLMPPLGFWLTTRETAISWAKFSSIGLLILPLIALQARYAPLYIDRDPSLEIANYHNLPPSPAFVIATSWIEGGKIWIAYKGQVPVYVMGNDQRNFGIDRTMKGLEGRQGLYISSEKRRNLDELINHFEKVVFLHTLNMRRHEKAYGFDFTIYALEGLTKPLSFTPFKK